MSIMKQTVPPRRHTPTPADGGEAALVRARAMESQEDRWEELRTVLKGKLISCNDCRGLRDAVVMLMDIMTKREDTAIDAGSVPSRTIEGSNSSVTIIPPMEGQDDGGQEVAPGVRIYPPGQAPNPNMPTS